MNGDRNMDSQSSQNIKLEINKLKKRLKLLISKTDYNENEILELSKEIDLLINKYTSLEDESR